MKTPHPGNPIRDCLKLPASRAAAPDRHRPRKPGLTGGAAFKTIAWMLALAGLTCWNAMAITWGAATTIAGDTDVSTTGTLKYAYHWAAGDQTVNGVTFTGTTSTTGGGGDVGLSGFGAQYSLFTTASPPFASLSTAYKAMLAGSPYNGGELVTVQLNNLTPGNRYAVQIWCEDPRSNGNGRNATLTSTGGNSVTLDYNSTDADGGVGQYSIGIFTATATTQVFTIDGTASTQLNALQVRDLGIPTSITWGAATTIAGDTDVSTTGTLKYAYHWATGDQTVNGVTFTGTTNTTGGGGNVGLSGFDAQFSGFTNASAPFASLSTAYQAMLAGSPFNGSGQLVTVQLNNLTPGNQYAVQIWCEDPRSAGNGRNATLTSTGGNSVTLDYNSADAAGGVGQYSIGIFTATAGPQVFTIDGSASTLLNALQVRDITAGYGNWANGTFVPPLTAKLPTDNQDGDTLNNLQEYAFGTNPTVSTGGSISYVAGGAITATGLPVATNFAVGGGVDFRGVFGRRKDYVAAGLTYTPQFSVDLISWTNSAATPTVLTGAGGANPSEIEAVSVPYPLFIPYTRDGIPGFEKPTFFRVAVSQP